MSLSHDIISEFVKVTNNNKEKPKEGIVYATIVQGSDGKYIKIDGSDLLTPADTTTDIEDGERVTVMIKDHKATVTGNVTAPSASGNRVDKVVETVTEQIGVFETVVADKVSTNELEAYKATIEYLVAGKATIEDLEATNAVIENLKVKDAEIENLVADKATIEDLEVVNAKIENLEVKDAEIENAVIDNLEATKAEIKILNADFAQIKTLVSGNLTSDNILSFNITADKVTMEDAFIKDAMIDTVNASKINAGRINTNSVSIGSEDGGMLIAGATQQFTDKNGNVRIQIGRDTSGDFTFALYGEDGQGQLINQNGITASAIADGLIVNDMVSNDAAISGSKLDISSVVTEINNDNTTTIKSNKIYLDEQNQSLEVAFKSLKTQVDTIKDIDSDLTTITDKIQSNTSKIEANKSSISTLLAEDAAIKKQVTDLEGNVVETTNTLTSKYTTLQQNLDGFKTSVNNTYATKSSINDVKNNLSTNYSTTSAMNSTINQKVDEISASVSSTYATKNEVQSIDNNIKTNYSTTEQMESAISVAKDEINLGISKVYETKTNVESKISSSASSTLTSAKSYTDTTKNTLNTEIGKKANSADVYTKTQTYTKTEVDSAIKLSKDAIELGVSQKYETKEEVTNKVTTVINNIKIGDRNLIRNGNKEYTNNDYRTVGYTPSSFLEKGETYTIVLCVTPAAGVQSFRSYLSGGYRQQCVLPVSGTNKQILSASFKADYATGREPSDNINYGLLDIYRFPNNGTVTTNSTIHWCKVIKGNKTSLDFTPAPEDVDTSITTAETNAVTTSKNYTDSQIKISKDAIELGVSQKYETKTSVTSQVSTALTSAKSYADTKKSEAIASANNTLNSTIANYYTKTQTDSQIKIAKDAINLGVSETYETKTNVESKINSIQIGGRNLLKGTSSLFKEFTMNEWYCLPYDYLLSDLGLKVGDKVAFKLYLKFGNTLCGGAARITFLDTAGKNIKTVNNAVSVKPNSEGYSEITTEIPANAVRIRVGAQRETTGNGLAHFNFQIKEPKLEQGTKCSTWSPAPEDISSDITTAKTEAINTAASDATNKANNAKNEAITSANNTLNSTIANYYTKAQTDSQINVAKNAITSSVSSTYETKTNVTNKINGVNSSISSLQTRMNAAEQKITDSAITNVVKQNFYTKTETDKQITSKGYQTASQVQQTVDQLQVKFTESGGYNLLRNGGFENGITFWSTNNNPGITENQVWQNYHGKSIFVSATAHGSGIFQHFSTVPGKIYSYSFYAQAEHGTWWAGVENRHTQNIEVSPNNWRRYTGTFTATNNSHAFICYAHGSGRNVFLDNIIVCEGALPSEYTPHPSEIYDGITTINRDGVTVDCSDVNTKAQMRADGFKVIRKSDNKELFNASNGNLTMEGTLATGKSGKYIKVSDSNYKVYDGTTQKAFFGLASNDVWTDVPKLYMGIRGWGESCGYDYFSINTYDASSNPQSHPTAYLDLAYYNINRKDYSNIKMYGDGNILLAPINKLIITSNTYNGNYNGTAENKIAEFGTSVSGNYNGYLDIGAISNHNKNANGLVLEHNRNGVWCAARVNVDSNNEKFFRPMTNAADMKCGSSGFKWHSVWASNGSVQTSDERYKMKMGYLDMDDCYEMVKNTALYKYCMLPKSKERMSEVEVRKMAKVSSDEDIAIQTGIMAQEILDYSCSKYILTHDTWVEEDTGEEQEMYNINPYGFSTSIMGALKKEIEIRDAQYQELKSENEKLKKELAEIKKLSSNLIN